MNNCSNCKHWEADEKMPIGICKAVTTIVEYVKSYEKGKEIKNMMIPMYSTVLYTHKNHYCTNYDAKI